MLLERTDSSPTGSSMAPANARGPSLACVDDRPGARSSGRVAAADPAWPTFLDDLDCCPALAQEALAQLLHELLNARPWLVRPLPEHMRDDVLPDVFLACVERDFRRLRSYRNRGRPFVHWLCRIVSNHVRDRLRSWTRECVGRISFEDSRETTECLVDGSPGPLRHVEARERFRRTWAVVNGLGGDAPLLIAGAAFELSGRELAVHAGRCEGDRADRRAAKHVLDSLRYVRGRLAVELSEQRAGG